MEYAWGSIWARPGLDHKTRSMITIAMLVGMGKLDELKLHIRATLKIGASRDEVKELLMHAAIYCGVPAAFGAFQLAAQIFDEMGKWSGCRESLMRMAGSRNPVSSSAAKAGHPVPPVRRRGPAETFARRRP